MTILKQNESKVRYMMSSMRQLEERALLALDDQKDDLFSLLSRLIQFDSQNFCGTGNEKECAEFVAGLYQELGLETEIYCPDSVPGVTEHPLYWPGHNTDKRPNVNGVLWGEDRDSLVMVAAHTDTMPTGDMDAWHLSPFSGAIMDGKIYGLGSSDNKFGLAGSYFALKVLEQLGVKLKKSVVLTAYCDEEYGGGNGALAACLRYPCETYVNLDGGNYEMWATALGGGCFAINLHLDRTTDNCEHIYDVMAAVVSELKKFGKRRRDELEQNPYYKGTDTARSAFRIGRFGTVGENHIDARVEFVIYTDRSKKEIESEMDDILSELRPMFTEYGVSPTKFVPTSRFFDYVPCDEAHPSFRIMKECAQEACGHPVKTCGSCLTDLSVILAAGKTSAGFNFGILREFSLPGGAHQPNEFVSCDQFLEHTKALILYLIRYCGISE